MDRYCWQGCGSGKRKRSLGSAASALVGGLVEAEAEAEAEADAVEAALRSTASASLIVGPLRLVTAGFNCTFFWRQQCSYKKRAQKGSYSHVLSLGPS